MASSDALPIPLKNTAFRVTFPILDADGDLVSGATGLDSEVSKDGGAFADCTNEATEIGSTGIYYLDLTSTEMNADTVAVIVKTTSTGAKTTPIVIYPAEDAELRANTVQFGGTAGTFSSGRPEVNTTHAAGTAWNSGAITANTLASGALTAAKFAAGAFDAVWSVATRILTAATNITSTGGTTVPQTGDSFARIGAPAGASISADIAAVKGETASILADTAEIGAAGAGLTEAGGTGDHLTAVPWNAAWDAEVQSECEDALVAKHLDHLVAATGTVSNPGGGTATVFNTDLTAADGTYNDQLIVITSGALAGQVRPILSYDQTNGEVTLEEGFTDAPSNGVTFIILAFHAHPVSQIQNGLATASAQTTAQNDLDILTGTDGATLATSQPNYAPSKAGDAMALTSGERTTLTAAIWAALTSGLSTVGSIGKLLVDNINATIGSRSSQTTADAIEADTQDIQSRLPSALVSGRIDASVGAMAANTLTASALATDAVTEIQSGLSTLDAAGVRTAVGLASANLDSQLGALPTAAENADAVWDEARSGHTTSGTFGEGAASVQGNVTGSVASVTGAVGSVTGNVGGSVASVTGAVGSVTAGVSLADNAITAAKYDQSTAFPATSSDGTHLTEAGGTGDHLTGIPKTGYKLASDGLDSVSTTAPSGVASNFREMVIQTWRRLFRKTTLTATELKTYADDGSTVVTTQTVSDDNTTQTQGAAS